jgi:ABC-type polar amino acid transport system ATPase subunit
MSIQTFVKVENITKKYGDLLVLKDISFEVERSEVLVLVGPSGCGKSTLLRCINGLEKIEDGQIWVGGFHLRGASHKELMKIRLMCGIVFQNFNLFPHMTTLKNITLAPIKILKQNKQEAQKNAIRLLEAVGIPEKAKSYPFTLSGGQRQRLAIARALAMKPQLMLFDEPTSALDPEMKEEVLNVIRRLHDEDRMTMILVTHEVNFAKNVANRVMMIEDRGIVETADPKTFFENPKEERTKKFLRSILNMG